MTITRLTDRRTPGSPAADRAPSRRPRAATCPDDGDGRRPRRVEQARKAMLHEVEPRKRTRIGADVVCEALLRQGVDVIFAIRAA